MNTPGPKIVVTLHSITIVDRNQQMRVHPVTKDGLLAEIDFEHQPMVIYVNQEKEYVEIYPIKSLGDPKEMRKLGATSPSGRVA
jgi:hypothetical protein